MPLDLGADLHESWLRISPIHSDYATLPIQTGFDWSPLHGCVFDELYLVVFRSARRPDADLVLLRKYDDRADEEAMRSGGLLRYFKGHANDRAANGSPSASGRTREQAREAAGAASHKSAAGITALTYISYTLDRYWLKRPGMDLTFERIRSELREQPLALSSQPKS